MIKIGVIGCGHWGPNHIRIFSQLPDSEVLMCADLDLARLENIKRLFPHVSTTPHYKDLLANKEIDAVCITTPTNTHYSLTKEALEAGKNVLCEKPLALTVKECEELRDLAHAKKKMLMVGHVFVFNPGILMLKKILQSADIGRIFYAYSTRTNLGPFRYDVNALWDLAPHDISIFNYLFEGSALNVSARGQKSLGTSLEDLAFATLEYPNNIVVNLHVSWLDPKKVRQITIVGEKKMITWDDLDNLGPVKIYDKHVEKTSKFYETYGEFQLLSREGTITIPNVEFQEPLKAQGKYFLDCVKNNRTPDLADAKRGLEVVRTLCAIQRSMDKEGSCEKV